MDNGGDYLLLISLINHFWGLTSSNNFNNIIAPWPAQLSATQLSYFLSAESPPRKNFDWRTQPFGGRKIIAFLSIQRNDVAFAFAQEEMAPAATLLHICR